MEAVNGVSDGDKGGPPPPSPLTGCYLLIVVGEPHCNEHKDIILQRVAKGLLSWDLNDCLVDLGKELAIITEQALEGEEARYGERLIQFASENLVTEILIHPVVSTLAQCVRNLLSSFTRHRHIIHAGYTFAHNGSWVLQDGTFSSADFSEAFQELEVLRVIRAYENGISVDLHCAPEGDWTRLPKEPFTKGCKVRVNPNDVLTAGSPSISNFINYLEPFLVSAELDNILESSDVVGNIRFSRPTLYVFPGGQGDAALFGINGFNMLLDGGFSRKACFWDFVRHLDRLDAVLLTRLNNSNVNGISAVLRRKKKNALYPQIGHFFCNIQERKAILSPDGDKDKDPLLINLLDEGQEIVSNLRHLSLIPQVCYRDSEPINLYHKVGHGTLDMYVLSPAKDSKEVREFLQKWNNNDQKLFANHKTNKDFVFPLQNLVSICALLVWQPANPEDTITRILFPGSSPQNKIFEGLEKIKSLEFIKHSVCSEKTLAPTSIIKAKQSVIDRIIQPEKKIPMDNKKDKVQKPPADVIDDVLKNGEINGEKTAPVKKSDSTESEKSISKPKRILENGDKVEKLKPTKPKAEPRTKPRSESQQRKARNAEKKPSPTTPKKQTNDEQAKLKPKPSPTATPAKSTKEANNRKVVESKIRSAPPRKEAPRPIAEKKEVKVERKPISRRPKDIAKLSGSPSKKVNGVQKPDSISRRGKLDKEGTTDSSTVSTPSAEQDSILKKDISKLTSDEIQNLKAQELADLKEEQEAVKEIEAVFRKGELHEDKPSDFRKIKDLSIDDKLESEEYLIIEKTEIQQDLVNESNKEEETQKIARDSEESEKQRRLSEEKEKEEVEENRVEIQDEVQKIITSATDIVKAKEEVVEASKEVSATSPEDKVDVSTDKKDIEEIKEVAQESQPDEKGSANIESGATTTAPTLPEDERMPLDEIKEDNGDQVIEEKHVKEDTKEKDVPVIQLPPKALENIAKLPPVVGIRLDKQSHIRDIVKTPDEVADLPVHEEVEFDHFDEYPSTTDTKSTPEEAKKDEKEDKKNELITDNGEVEKADETKEAVLDQKTDVEVKKEEIKTEAEKGEKVPEVEGKTVISEDLNKKELSKSPDEEKEKDERELEQQKDIIKDDVEVKKEEKEIVKDEEVEKKSKKDLGSKPEKEETVIKDEQKEGIVTAVDQKEELDNGKESFTQDVIEKSETEVKEKDALKQKEAKEEDLTQLIEKLPDVPKEDIVIAKAEALTEEQKLKEDVCKIQVVEDKLQQLKEQAPEVVESGLKTVEEVVAPKEKASVAESKKEIAAETKKEEVKLKEEKGAIEKIEEKLQKLKDDIQQEEVKAVSEIVTHKVEEAQHAEPVIITTDSLPDSPGIEEKPMIEDKLELGRKSPKEREEDVIKIVASVAEVLKSDAPLEEFEGKIPFSIPYKSYTTELRETHITTVESPVADENKTVEKTICPKASSTHLIEEERKIAPIHEEPEIAETRASKMIKDSNELMQATSRMIQDIKLSQPHPDQILEEPQKEEQDGDNGTVHRMLVTTSSEDGGEEIEICPPGTITFSRSSESSGRSSPDLQSQKLSQKSSMADTVSDATVITKKDSLAGGKADDNKEDTKDSVIEKAVCDIEKVVDDVKETLDKVAQISDEKEITKPEAKEEVSPVTAKDEVTTKLETQEVAKPDMISSTPTKQDEKSDKDKKEKEDDELGVQATKAALEKGKPEEQIEIVISEFTKIKDDGVALEEPEKEVKDQKADVAIKEETKEVKQAVETVKEKDEDKLKDVTSVFEDKTIIVDKEKKEVIEEKFKAEDVTTFLEDSKAADVEKTEVTEVKSQSSVSEETKVVDEEKDKIKEDIKLKDAATVLEDSKVVDVAKKEVIEDKTKLEDKPNVLEKTKIVEDKKKTEDSVKLQEASDSVSQEKGHVEHLREAEKEETKPDISEAIPSEIDKKVEEKSSFFGGLVNDIGASLLHDTSKIIEDAQKQAQDIKDGLTSKTEDLKEDVLAKKEEVAEDTLNLVDGIEDITKTSKEKTDEVKETVKTEARELATQAGQVVDSVETKVEKDEVVKGKDTVLELIKPTSDEIKEDVIEGKEKLVEAVKEIEKSVIKEETEQVKSEIEPTKEAIEKQMEVVEEAVSDTKQTLVEEIADIKDTVSKDVTTKVEEVKKDVTEAAEKTKDQVGEVCKLVEEKVEEKITDVQKGVDEGLDKTKEAIGEGQKLVKDTKEKIGEQITEEIKDVESKAKSVLEDTSSVTPEIKEAAHKVEKAKTDVAATLDGLGKHVAEAETKLKDGAKSTAEEISSLKQDLAEEKSIDQKYDLVNGLETVEKMVVDVLTADREEVSPKPDSPKKTDDKPAAAKHESEESFVKEFVKDTKDAISALFKRDSSQEEVLEKSAHDIEENYDIVSDMAKSVVFEKCDKGEEQHEKQEKQWGESADSIEKEFDVVTDMAKSIVFDKCENLSEEQREERALEKSATDLEKHFETVSDMAQSVVFETCEKHDKEKEENHEIVTDMAQSIVFDKIQDKHDEIFDVSKTDVTDKKEAKQDVVKEQVETAATLKDDKAKESPVKSSGKSSPEKLGTKDVHEDVAAKISGKSSPDKPETEVVHEDVAGKLSGKSSPEKFDSKVIQDDLTAKASGKASPALPSDLVKEESGKSTPDKKESIKDESGKSTPDIIEVDHIKVDNQDSLLSGKSSPGLSGKSSPALSGRSSPAKAESKDSLLSDKSTPEHTKPDSKESSLSGKSSSSLSSESKSDEKEKAEKLAVETKESSTKSSPAGSGKTSPALPAEVDKIEKSTPEIKLDKDVKEEKEKFDKTKDAVTGKDSATASLDKESEKVVSGQASPLGKLEKEEEKEIIDAKSDILSSKDVKSDLGKEEIVKIAGDIVTTSTISEKKTDEKEDKMEKLRRDSLEVQSTVEKKLSVSDVQVTLKDTVAEKEKSGSPEEAKQDDKTEAKDLDSVDSGIDTEVDSKSKKLEESQKSEKSVDQDTKSQASPTKTLEIKEGVAGPSVTLPEAATSPAKTSNEDLHLSGKSTPDIAEVEKMKEMEESIHLEKHIHGSSTPPTVPVSPIVKEISSIQTEESKPTSAALKSVKDNDIRSCTPGSDDYEIGASTHSDISSGQVSRAPHLLESERIESDEEDDVPGSPMSVTSQVAHSRSSSRYDFEDERIGTKLDPMNTSFYGALPDEEDPELDFDKALAEHRQTRGQDLVAAAEESPSYLYEVTKAKFSAKTPEPEPLTGQTQLDQINKNGAGNVMTASFMGDLPESTTSSESKKDVLESWGKPLGLPSPAPPTDNRGTPKKEKKLPSNVSAKNKLNDDKKRAESPSKYKNKKFNPVYVDLTYVPHHGNSYYSYVDFFKRVRARYYVFSGIEPSREVYSALLEAKQTWEDKELEVTIIPTYDTDILGYWVAENEELLTKCKIDLSPSASRCTINLQDHETSCSAYRLEF